MMSIRNRLLLWLLAPLVPAAIFFMWAVYVQVRSTTQTAYDQVLLGSALAIADRVVLENDALSVDVPYVALQMLTRAAEERVFYSVLSLPQGQIVTGYRNMPKLALDSDQPVFKSMEFRGEQVRVVGIKDRALSYGREQAFAVLVAETTGRRTEITQQLIQLSIGAGVALVLGTLVMALLAVHLGLRPLALLADAIAERTSRDLRSIVRRVPPEAAILVKEINALLARLESALENHRSFVRTTSHQLRTPLAEIKTEIELSADLGEELDKRKLAKRVDALSRLVGQILMLSRVEDQMLSQENAQPVDLVIVGQDAVAAHWTRANAEGIDLGLEVAKQSEAQVVSANRPLLDEAINNLLDNVLLHAKGATSATIRVESAGIAVLDNAPTPSPKNLLRHLDGSGSGRFGLSIVKQIADLSGASLVELPNGLRLEW